ncbi:MAG: Methylated-DNA/protein-cysteinemethyltransferase [Candidatus Curtissbacteria bacterium GW2011_GWA1_40_16]|uniref:Methylated-DNA/protein-cysteinemethyltransferase n=1 Tax=Candidatus Curtissbacteria bacterium GW2011_GWA1_40_16 TaxID=1618405 RepID=A0A0G0RJY3_9BACT|nr:MAG: Methylated-DNA/protein-cysteinemethyltransferase [Candidatus Curtissbacteria bacterium GW2011_GWA1_40_16]
MSKIRSKPDFRQQVYTIVKKIPKGKVATYGQVARIIQNSKIKDQNFNSKIKISNKFAPRLVGYALHSNKSANVPCHRVVDRNGRLAPNFAFDGWKEQKRRLEEEGVKFVDELHVDLDLKTQIANLK